MTSAGKIGRAVLLGVAGVLAVAPAASADGPATVRAGGARFEVISPTLVRVEYAADGRFEDSPTITVPRRAWRVPRFSVKRTGAAVEIRTAKLALRYSGTGAFSAANLSVRLNVGKRAVTVAPVFGPPAPAAKGPPLLKLNAAVAEAPGYTPPASGNLGGWYRALDVAGAPVRLHDGLISRDGWYLLDDTQTALLTRVGAGFAVRPAHAGAYQDGYLFGYGHDYAAGLGDLRRLTGPAPLLPRQAFGVWFSRYFAYKQSEYPGLVGRFRAEKVPVDVLPVDTDFKAPHNWNGWNWNTKLFPDPPGFFAWAKRQGIAVGLNTHPSISNDDPQLPAAEQRAGRVLPGDPTVVRCIAITAGAGLIGNGVPDITPGCRVFDFARAGDQAAYFGLHEPFERAGNDFWWLDYCCDEPYALAPGLTQDTWMNQLYADRNRARGSRWPVLSRIGASVFEVDSGSGTGVWAEHRNTIHFTGDTLPRWSMLDFQTAFTAAEGNVGMPYVSHDIGSFAGPTSSGASPKKLAPELYARWVQSGAFQPILRLHSDHGLRLPWDYGGRAGAVATRFLRLRGSLLPHLYTLAHEANVAGLPLTRAMYLGWPEQDAAYRYPHQYMLGRDLLVAPVATPGDPATKEVWFPPGTWTDIFTGTPHRGPAVERLAVPLDRMPVFARAGAVVPRQGYRSEGNVRPASRVIVEAYPGRRGSTTLYEDEGSGLAYERGRSALTRLAQRRTRKEVTVSLGRARGKYSGAPRCRRFEVRVHGVARPRAASFGKLRYDRSRRVATVTTGCLRVSRTRVLSLRLG